MNLNFKFKFEFKRDYWNHLRFKGIIVGFLTDLFLTTLISIGFGLIFAMSLPTNPVIAPEEVKDYYQLFLERHPFYLIGILILGLNSTFIGGFLSAWIGGTAADASSPIPPCVNSSFIGFIGLISGIVFFERTLPLWFTLSGILLVLPVSILAGYFAFKVLGKNTDIK